MDPVAWARARASGNRFFTAPKQRQHKAQIQSLVSAKWKHGPIDGPIAVALIFTIKRPASVSEKKRPLPVVKCDLDNYIKIILDSLNGITWIDDAQIVTIEASKVYGKTGNTKIQFTTLGGGNCVQSMCEVQKREG